MQYTVEKGSPEQNRQDILNLWEQNFQDRQEKRFTWMYENNPLGAPDIWLLREPSGNIVGAVGVCRRKFFFDGSAYEAGQPMDFIINQRHRSLGPALLMQRTIIKNMDQKRYDLLYAFPNNKSRMVQKRAGYVQLDQLSHWRLVLRSEQSIQRRLHIDNLITNRVGYLLDTCQHLKHKVFSKKLPQSVSCHSADCLEGDIESLWQSAVEKKKMIGKRDNTYLQWRFFQHPTISYRIFYMTQDSSIVGYIIYSLQEGTVKIADFLSRDSRTDLCLFNQFIINMEREGAISISLHTCGSGKNLLQNNFSKKNSSEYILTYLHDSLPSSALLQPESWHLTIADRDV